MNVVGALLSVVEWHAAAAVAAAAIVYTFYMLRCCRFLFKARFFPTNRSRCDIEFITKAHGQRLWRFL